jgi:hypothetical protein
LIAARLNPDWYRVKYSLAALHTNWAGTLREAEPRDEKAIESHLEQGHKLSEEVARDSLQQLVERPAKKTSTPLRKLLEDAVLPAALNLYAATGTGSADAGLGQEWDEQDETGDQRQLLAYLEEGLDERVALDYVTTHAPPTPRVLYNLACAWAAIGEPDQAMDTLRKALAAASKAERRVFARLARKDPSFAPLREKTWKEEFEALLAAGR